jgi:hypothetical protein
MSLDGPPEALTPEPDPPAGSGESTSPPGRVGGYRRRLLARLRPANLDLRNTWQVVVGSLLLPLGIAVIILAWDGAAHGRVTQQQLPYVLSGGGVGLALVVIGCFFYWAHWLYRIYDQADLHHQEEIALQRELFRQLIDVVGAGRAPGGPVELPGRPASGRLSAPSGPAAPGRTPTVNGSHPVARRFVATPTGTNFHTAGCPMVAHRGDSLRWLSEEEAATMKPCRVCEPLVHAS